MTWIGAIVALLLSSFPAVAQQVPCGERQAVLRELAEGYQERPVARGLTAGGILLEIIASPSGSFTMLLTRPGGITCLGASGQNFEILDGDLKARGEQP